MYVPSFQVIPLKIGRKWVEVSVISPKGYTYKAQMTIPTDKEKLELNKEIKIFGEMESEISKYGSKFTITFISFSQEEAEKIKQEKEKVKKKEREKQVLKEIEEECEKERARKQAEAEAKEKWRKEHPEEYAKQLRKAELEKKQREKARAEQLKKEELEKKRRAAEKMLYWVEKNAKEGKVYSNGIKVIKESGVQEYIEKADRILKKYDLDNCFYFTSKVNPDIEYSKGDIFIEEGRVYKVLSCRKTYNDDYTSFFSVSVWDNVKNGYYVLFVKDVTEREEGRQAFKKKEEAIAKEKQWYEYKQNMLKLAETIKNKGKKYSFDIFNNNLDKVYKTDCFSNEDIEIFKGKTAYYLYHAYYGYDYSGKYPEWGRLTEYYRCNENLIDDNLLKYVS